MKPTRSTLDWVLEGVSLLALLVAVAIVATYWDKIPTRIPPRIPRFRPPGPPNPWNAKNAVWILMAINAGTYLLLTVAGHFQKLISIPPQIDRESPHVRQLLFSMMIVVKAVMMLFSVYLIWTAVNIGMGHGRGISRGFLTLFVLAIPVPLFLYTVKLRRYRR